MLPYPTATTNEEKLKVIDEIKNRIINTYGDSVLAIGVYGSIALGTDGPFSDIEMHVVAKDGTESNTHEFIYGKFKIEINVNQKSEIFKQAREVDDAWSIKAGVFTNIKSIYDPSHLFDKIKSLPFLISDKEIKAIMREFMIWEPYETMAKIRNNYQIKNLHYIPLGAKDLVWQTSKLIGLSNKHIYSTRARVFEESLRMESKPAGYQHLVVKVMEGKLDDKELIYLLCEDLWTGLNEWYAELGIEYRTKELPF